MARQLSQQFEFNDPGSHKSMSPVGHSLVGLAFAAIALPKNSNRKWLIGLPVSFIALASLPDWPIPSWGHDRYDISHSIFVNASLVFAVFALLYSLQSFRSIMPTRCLWLGAGAWLSHLLLDSFYNHGRGVAIFWPFSDGRLNIPLPWFSTLDLSQSMVSPHNLSVYMIEFVGFAPVLILSVGIRWITCRKPVSVK